MQVHFDRGAENTPTSAAARKLMHRFSEAQVETAMDETARAADRS